MVDLNTRVSNLIISWIQEQVSAGINYFTDPDGPGPLKSGADIEFRNYITNYFNPFVLITVNLVLSKLENISTSFNSEVVNQAIVDTLKAVQTTQVSAQNVITDPRLAQLYASVKDQFEDLVKNAVFTAIGYLNPAEIISGTGGTGSSGDTGTSNPLAITSLSPSQVAAGTQNATNITVTGTNFTENTIAYVNGSARDTLFTNSTTIVFILTSMDAASQGNLNITLSNDNTNYSSASILSIV